MTYHISSVALIGALFAGTTLQAAPMVFDNRDAFIAATNPEVSIDFNDVDDVGFVQTRSQ